MIQIDTDSRTNKFCKEAQALMSREDKIVVEHKFRVIVHPKFDDEGTQYFFYKNYDEAMLVFEAFKNFIRLSIAIYAWVELQVFTDNSWTRVD